MLDCLALTFQVSATDNDAGINGTIVYNISSHFFTIDANNGRILTTVSLDREQIARHTIIVSATDGGVPAKVICNLYDEWF